jgi:hypothetical protein
MTDNKPYENPKHLDPREEGERPSGDVAIIGERGGEGQEVSMKALQDIYNELTGKSEELVKQYSTPFVIHFSDLEQLNHKMVQSMEQYQVEGMNCSVHVYQQDDTKEVFSSFERFRIYNKSSTSPVESVLVKYNFMIILPRTRRPQTYTISVRVVSRITMRRSLREQFTAIPGPVFISGPTGVVSVDYVDYTVARNFLNVVEGWFETLDEAPVSGWIKVLRKGGKYLSSLTAYFLLFTALWICLYAQESLLLPEARGMQSLASFLLVALTSIYVSHRFGRFLGRNAQSAIENWEELAYICLNRGDEKEVATARRSNRTEIIRAISNMVVAFVLGVAGSLVASWLLAG